MCVSRGTSFWSDWRLARIGEIQPKPSDRDEQRFWFALATRKRELPLRLDEGVAANGNLWRDDQRIAL